MSRLLNRMQRLFPQQFDFVPRTWRLPSEYDDFCKIHQQRLADASRQNPVYIVKPDDGAHGTGIFLTTVRTLLAVFFYFESLFLSLACFFHLADNFYLFSMPCRLRLSPMGRPLRIRA